MKVWHTLCLRICNFFHICFMRVWHLKFTRIKKPLKELNSNILGLTSRRHSVLISSISKVISDDQSKFSFGSVLLVIWNSLSSAEEETFTIQKSALIQLWFWLNFSRNHNVIFTLSFHRKKNRIFLDRGKYSDSWSLLLEELSKKCLVAQFSYATKFDKTKNCGLVDTIKVK